MMWRDAVRKKKKKKKKKKNNLYIYYIMPPKPKKQKKTKVKAVAKTKRGSAQAQAQVQNVVVKIGETKKAVAKRRPPRKKADDQIRTFPPPPPPFFDGYYPPQNLTRNGSFPFQIAPPVLSTSGSASSFIAGPPAPTTPFVPVIREMDMQSGFDAMFAPEADPVLRPETPVELPAELPAETPATEKKQRPLLREVTSNISDAFKALGYKKSKQKQEAIRSALGERYVEGKSAGQYTRLEDAEAILAVLRSRLREKQIKPQSQPMFELVTEQQSY